MRTVDSREINSQNDTWTMTVMGERGSDGAHHHYRITTRGCKREPDVANAHGVWDIVFQNGSIDEVGVNGLTSEALLFILVDRLRSFQSGPSSSRENALALTKCEEALHWLQQRTLDRMRRGVEGKSAA